MGILIPTLFVGGPAEGMIAQVDKDHLTCLVSGEHNSETGLMCNYVYHLEIYYHSDGYHTHYYALHIHGLTISTQEAMQRIQKYGLKPFNSENI